MLCSDRKLSIYCFIASSVITTLPEVFCRLEFEVPFAFFRNIWLTHVCQYGILNLLLLLLFRGFTYQVSVRAAFLGYSFGIGILTSIVAPSSWQMFGIYLAVLATFHYTEFLSIAWINPTTVSIDSFILNHSIGYGVAACSSWIEFVTERYYFPEMKELSTISCIGIVLCVCGETMRKLAMFTAKHNFNHIVQSEKMDNHQLVTHGVYKICRHPSYMGWFYWSIGTQLILQNPFCFVAYAITSWKFFHDRILLEEITLLDFFGQNYIEYQKEVGTGLPFINGYKVSL